MNFKYAVIWSDKTGKMLWAKYFDNINAAQEFVTKKGVVAVIVGGENLEIDTSFAG